MTARRCATVAKRRKPQRKCEPCGKPWYATQSEAIRTILPRVKAARGLGLRFYPCPHGNGFHLTKQKKRNW